MKKHLFSFLFCLLLLPSLAQVHGSEFGWDVRAVHWTSYDKIRDTFNLTHPGIVNYLESPSRLKGIAFRNETYLTKRVLVYGGLGYLASRYKTQIADTAGNITESDVMRSRTISLGGGFSFAVINSKFFRIIPSLGVDATNYDHGVQNSSSRRFESKSQCFQLNAHASVGIFIGSHGCFTIRPYYLYPFWKNSFYELDKFFNPSSHDRHNKNDYRETMSCFGVSIGFSVWGEGD